MCTRLFFSAHAQEPGNEASLVRTVLNEQVYSVIGQQNSQLDVGVLFLAVMKQTLLATIGLFSKDIVNPFEITSHCGLLECVSCTSKLKTLSFYVKDGLFTQNKSSSDYVLQLYDFYTNLQCWEIMQWGLIRTLVKVLLASHKMCYRQHIL